MCGSIYSFFQGISLFGCYSFTGHSFTGHSSTWHIIRLPLLLLTLLLLTLLVVAELAKLMVVWLHQNTVLHARHRCPSYS